MSGDFDELAHLEDMSAFVHFFDVFVGEFRALLSVLDELRIRARR